MRRLNPLLFVVLLVFQCNDKNPQKNTESKPDGFTRATPKGGELLPAERGPVRDAFNAPPIDLSTFALTVDGMVDSSLTLSWPQILQMQQASSDTMIMYCVEGWEVYGVWKGVSVAELLKAARPQPEATHILFQGVDGYTTALPLAYLLKYNAMLAYQVNGAPLLKHDGYPLRLVAFGLLGYKWAKYVNRLQLIQGTRYGFWERLGYDNTALVPLNRRFFYEGIAAQAIEY